MVARSGRTRDGIAWRLAPALVVLVDEVDARHPGRSTRSDGSIASAAHSRANPTSDHEVDVDDGLVKALDLTDDPPRFDPDVFADHVIARRDPRIKYVIKDDKIWRSYKTRASHPAPWTPEPYRGTNPHRAHAHFSVTDTGALDTRTWFPDDTPNAPEENDTMLAVIISIYDAHGHKWMQDPDGVAFWERHARAVGVKQLINDMLGAIWAAAVAAAKR